MTEPPATDTLAATAQSLLSLISPGPEQHPQDKIVINTALRQRIARVAENDLSDLESLLTCQAQLLHHIFTHSVSKYAESGMSEASHHHSKLAVRAQTCCRQTVNAINTLKSRDAVLQKYLNMQNELLRQNRNAAMDRGRKTAPAGADSWLAAMEPEYRK